MKEFKLSSLSLNNRVTAWILLAVITVTGIASYQSIPKEQFPDIDFPFFLISTVSPGTAAADVENIITLPLEKQLKGIDGVKEVNSQSLQDYSAIFIEFEVDADPIQAYIDLQKAIESAKKDLPSDLYEDPELSEIEVSEIPICYINMVGKINENDLKEFADDLAELIEGIPEVAKVDIAGAREREIIVEVDLYKMQAAGVTFKMINDAINDENVSMSGGALEESGLKRNLRIVGEFENVKQIENIVISNGAYLKDLARIKDGFKDVESFSRLDGESIITLNVIKDGGKNLIQAIDQVKAILEDYQQHLPASISATLTNDTSIATEKGVNNLFNTMILSVLTVVLVLMFFMGVRNAFNAGAAIPISILLTFIVIPMFGFTLNTVVLMGLIIVLGIIVDNSIVIVENILSYSNRHPDMPRLEQIKGAVAEVAIPVLSGTMTTIAPFAPLIFWPGIMGKFFIFIPVTVMITLVASILSAYLFNPLIAKLGRGQQERRKLNKKEIRVRAIVIIALIILSGALYSLGVFLVANIITVSVLSYLLYKFILKDSIAYFQDRIVPWLVEKYRGTIDFFIKGKRAYFTSSISILLLIMTALTFLFYNTPNVILFPIGDPENIYIYIEMPEGTHIEATNEVSVEIEKKVIDIIGKDNPDIENVITNVGQNAGGDSFFDRSQNDKLASINISFVEYEDRVGDKSSFDYVKMLRDSLVGFKDVEVQVDYPKSGPPTETPISLEVKGDEILTLIQIANSLKDEINSRNIHGIDKLEASIDLDRPEIQINIDRDKAAREGVSTRKIANAIRQSVYGSEISKFRDDEDEYQIRVRLEKSQRTDISTLLNQYVTVEGRSIPISSFASIGKETTFGSVNRKDFKRLVIISSNVLPGYNVNQVVNQVKAVASEFETPDGYTITSEGEQKDQAEQSAFLGWALMMAFLLIFMVLIIQFNSVAQPLIIMTQIVLSYVGIIWISTLFQIEFSIVMSGLGLVAVGGVVATNGIILIDSLDKKVKEMSNAREAVIEAASSRLVPVLLTASSTILGLLPLALEVNIDIQGFFTSLEPKFYFGGPTAAFWKPLALTLIVGLGFSTILTLLIEPAMYYIFVAKRKLKDKKEE